MDLELPIDQQYITETSLVIIIILVASVKLIAEQESKLKAKC